MTEKEESAAAVTEERLVATCGGIVRDYLAHWGYEVREGDGWSCDCEDAPIPDEASCDMLARRIAQGRLDDGAGPDLAIYDGLITREAV